MAVVVQHFVQRPQQVRKQCHHIHKVVEKDVVHRKAGQCIQAGAQHGIVPVADVPLEIEVRTAACRCKLEHQQRHHQVRQPALRKNEREPEERRTVQVERIGIHDSAAQVGGPGEGIVRCSGKGAVRVARPFDEAVHIAVKADLLAVEVAGIVEKSAVNDIKRQEEQRRGQCAQDHGTPELILLLSRQAKLPVGSKLFHGILFLRRCRRKLLLL